MAELFIFIFGDLIGSFRRILPTGSEPTYRLDREYRQHQTGETHKSLSQ